MGECSWGLADSPLQAFNKLFSNLVLHFTIEVLSSPTVEPYKAALSNLFGTRYWFHGRQFFPRPGAVQGGKGLGG